MLEAPTYYWIVAATVLVVAATSSASAQETQLPPRFTWFHGTHNTYERPVFGTKGVGDPTNTPGSLVGACTFSRKPQDELWLWGGLASGRDVGGTLNAFWVYNVSNNGTWTWAHGSNTLFGSNQHGGVFGSFLEPSPNNVPPARYHPGCWYDSEMQELWIFGGYILGGGSVVYANDLWKFTFSNMMWTWMGGSTNGNDQGRRGPLGSSSILYYPSGRAQFQTWFTESPKTLWLYGGSKNNTFEDLWSYDISTRKWTFRDFRANYFGDYVVGAELISIYPGPLEAAFTFTHRNTELYMFGGLEASNSAVNRIWRYNVTSGLWAWMGPALSGGPQSRHSVCAGYDSIRQGVVLFSGISSGSDVWLYDISSQSWSFHYGTNQEVVSSYQLPGQTAESNIPSNRGYTSCWYDSQLQELWIFGGRIWGSYEGPLNDVWLFGYGNYNASARPPRSDHPPPRPPQLAPESAPATAAVSIPASATPSSSPLSVVERVSHTLVINIQFTGEKAGQFEASDLNFVLETVSSVLGTLVGLNSSDIQIAIRVDPPKATLTVTMMIPVTSLPQLTSDQTSGTLASAINARCYATLASGA